MDATAVAATAAATVCCHLSLRAYLSAFLSLSLSKSARIIHSWMVWKNSTRTINVFMFELYTSYEKVVMQRRKCGSI